MKRINLKSSILYFILGVSLISCKPIFHVADINEDKYEIEQHDLLPEDEKINSIIQPYKEQLEEKMDKVIGNCAVTMYKARPEGELGNWMADILYAEASKLYNGKVDFAVQNHGGIRVPSLNAGPITVRDIYEIMPFDNELVILEAKGVVVKKLFERIAQKGGWPVSEQVKMIGNIDYSVESLRIGSEPFDVTKSYTFALPDYIANGGDNCSFLENIEQIKFNLLVRDAIINHLVNEDDGIIQEASKEGRIKFSKN